MNDEFEAGRDYKPNKADWLDGRWSHLDRNKEDYQRGKQQLARKLSSILVKLYLNHQKIMNCTRLLPGFWY